MKILWISDSITHYTGFGIQSHAILNHLKKSHQVLQLGWFCSNEIEHDDIQIKPLGSNYGEISDIKKYYSEFNPDIVISLGDIQMVEKLIFHMEDYIFKSKWIHWLPVDGEPYPEIFDQHIQNIEHLVLMSDFGYNLYKDKVKNIHKIYHGIDKETFKPIDNKELIRAREGLHNRFVCLLVAQNQWRKNIPSMIQSFASFAKDKKDVDLIIHTKPVSIHESRGWNLYELVNQHNLSGKVRISSDSYTTIKMNRLYNCANVLVSASHGEGFGLPHVEAMMAGLPVLLPDYTTSREQVLPENNEEMRCGELINIASFTIQSGVNIKRAVIDIEDATNKLQKYYNDWKNGESLLKRYGKFARLNAIRKYELSRTTREWEALIQKIALWQREHVIQNTSSPVILEEIL